MQAPHADAGEGDGHAFEPGLLSNAEKKKEQNNWVGWSCVSFYCLFPSEQDSNAWGFYFPRVLIPFESSAALPFMLQAIFEGRG